MIKINKNEYETKRKELLIEQMRNIPIRAIKNKKCPGLYYDWENDQHMKCVHLNIDNLRCNLDEDKRKCVKLKEEHFYLFGLIKVKKCKHKKLIKCSPFDY